MSQTAKRSAPEAPGVRGKALAAASRILAAEGVQGLSLRAIAESAGIGLASIYHYFASKEDLLVSLATMGFADLRQAILEGQTAPGQTSPMRGGAQAFFAFAQARPALFSLMFSERLLAGHASLREAEHGVLLAYKAAVEADDRIPIRHQENAAYALWALGRGMASIIASYGEEAMPPELLQKLFAGGGYLIDRPD